MLKEKTFSIESTTRENESLETLNSVEKLCEEAKAKMRQREKPKLDEKTREVNTSVRELETVTRRMILAKNALQRDVKALNRSKQLASSERENKARIVRLKEAAANELIDVEDELENALNVSDITENKSTKIDALIRELEIET